MIGQLIHGCHERGGIEAGHMVFHSTYAVSYTHLIRGLAKSLHISVLTVQKAYDVLQTDGFIETTAGKGCFVSAQNQDFYLEEQQKKIERHFTDAIEIAKVSGITLDKLHSLLALLYEEE